MKKSDRWVLALPFAYIFFFSYVIFFFLTAINSIYGFGVDSSGKLYVGKQSYIEVYENGELQKKIPGGKREYRMTVLENDTILISGTSYFSIRDLNGEELSFEEVESQYSPYDSISETRFTDQDGTTYFLKGFLRRKIVSDDGTILFQVPARVFYAKVGALLVCVATAVTVLVILARSGVFRMSNKKQTGGRPI